ncbi:MAG: hypothetical protein ABID40_05860 [Candidatus Bipolaricaulota bacterium]
MDLLRRIAFYPLGRLPLLFYLGVASYFLLLVTGATMVIARRMRRRLPVRFHHRLAYLTLALATIHGLLAIAGYL